MKSQTTIARLIAAALAASALPALAATPVFVNPTTAYLSSADIPLGFYGGGAPVLLETLEDGALGLLGLGSYARRRPAQV